MSYIIKVSDLTLGGTGIDNPIPLTLVNYQLGDWELDLIFVPVNVIADYKGTTYEVTGLAVWDAVTQSARVGPNDDIRTPCPPYC